MISRYFTDEKKHIQTILGVEIAFHTYKLSFNELFDEKNISCPLEFGLAVVVDFCQEAMRERRDLFLRDLNAFQEELLEPFFFGFDDVRKFNIYLVFVVDEETRQSEELQLFLQDLDYAKKIIVSSPQIGSSEETFSGDTYLYRYYVNYHDDLRLKGVASVRRLSHACDYVRLVTGMGRLLPENFLNDFELDDYIDVKRHNRDDIQEAQDVEMHEKPNFRRDTIFRRLDRRKLAVNKSTPSVKVIESVCFSHSEGDEVNLTFGRVNLFFGNNGAGKSTILEAIEKAMTGRAGHFRIAELVDPVMTFRDKDDNLVEWCAENESEKLVRQSLHDWYGMKSDDLNHEEGLIALQKQFRRYNHVSVPFLAAEWTIGEKHFDFLADIYFDPDFRGIMWKYNEARYSAGKIQAELEEMTKRIDLFLSRMKIPYELHHNESEEGSKRAPNIRNAVIKYAGEEWQKVFDLCAPEDFGSLDELYAYFTLRKDTIDQSIHILKSESTKTKENIKQVRGVQASLLQSSVRLLERYFLQIVADPNFNGVEFCSRKREIFVMRQAREGSERISQNKLSVGESACLRLAMKFTVLDSLNGIPSIMLLDEPTAHLDDVHIINLLDILRDLTFSGRQIFITTKDARIARVIERQFSFLGKGFHSFDIKAAKNHSRIGKKSFCSLGKPQSTENIAVHLSAPPK